MAYGLPARSAANWDTELDASVNAVKTTADGAAASTAAETTRATAVEALKAQRWAAAEAVTTGLVRQAPDGSWIKSTAGRTTGATFDATEQTFWTTVLATAGTLEKVALDASFVGFDMRPSGDASGAADQAALASLLTAAATSLRSKQIVLMPGIYYFDGSPVFTSGVRLVCLGGGETGGAEHGAVLRRVGLTALRFLDARNCGGLTFQGLIIQGGGSFAGTLLDLEGSQHVNITDCNLTGQGAARPARGADLKNANQITFTRVNFTTLVDGVRGLSATTAQYAEIIRFHACSFGANGGGGELSGVAIRNPNTDWLFTGCNFQPSSIGAPCAVAFDSTIYPAQGLTFIGCWWGDIGTVYAGTAPWLACSGLVNGVVVLGGNATMGTSAPFVAFGGAGNQYGLAIIGLTANAVPGGTSATFVALAGGGGGNVNILSINYVGTWGASPVTGSPGGSGGLIQQPLGGLTSRGFGLLASTSYNPAVNAAPALTTTETDVDATNVAVTFTAPPSGAVLVNASLLTIATPPTVTGAIEVYMSLRSGVSTVTGSRRRVFLLSADDKPLQACVIHKVKVSGLTPGTSYTYKLAAWKGTGGTANLAYGDDGTTAPLGPVVMEVWAA